MTQVERPFTVRYEKETKGGKVVVVEKTFLTQQAYERWYDRQTNIYQVLGFTVNPSIWIRQCKQMNRSR